MVTSVVVIDNDPIIRDRTCRMINECRALICLDSFADAESASHKINKLAPDVVLVELALPGLSGGQAVAMIADRSPSSNIIVVTSHLEESLIFDALGSGACGYLIKHEPPDRIRRAIEEAKKGGAPMSSPVARLVIKSFQNGPSESTFLTRRELEVLSELCRGHSYQGVADTLSISIDTVRGYVRNLYRKLEVHSKTEAVAKAIKTGLV